jgi:hypothetical protein
MDTPRFLPAEHRLFVERAMPLLQGDPRVLGVAAAGSWITGSMDEFSDLDFVVVARDSEYDSVMADRDSIAGSAGKLLSGFSGEHVGDSRVLICLYDEPLLHVDWKFIRLSDFGTRIENPVVIWERETSLSSMMKTNSSQHPMPDLQWIEDRFWVWIHYAALRLGRGELLEVIDFLSFVRGTVLGPLALVQRQQLPRGVRRIEFLASDLLEDFKATVPAYDRESCGDAIERSYRLYQSLRDAHPVSGLKRRFEAEKKAIDYLEVIRNRR